MKKLIPLIMLSLAINTSSAQEHHVTADSEIEQVNLFLSGAQVQRKASFSLKKGINRVVIAGVTAKLNAQSVKVGAEGSYIILSVSGKTALNTNPKKLPIIEMLEDSLDILSYQLDQERNKRYVLEQKESLLLANKNLKGDKGVILIDLEDALMIYDKQLTAIKQGQLDSRISERQLTERIKQMRLQLNEFKRSNQQKNYELIVTVSADRSMSAATMNISYFVQEANWKPTYDLRVKDLNSPVTLQYKAEVINNSGENWDNVKLHLSSGNPNLSGVPPVMNPQRLYYNDAVKPQNKKDKGRFYNSYRNTYMDGDGYAYKSPEIKGNRTNQQVTSFEHELAAPVKIIADARPVLLDLMDQELNGKYSYFAVPKLDEGAFLLTSISGWEDLNLLNGEANVYFENTYLGKTRIDATVTTDTLNISLGRDKGVVVERKKLKEFCSSNFSGSRKKEVLMYEITIRNTKSTDIQIEVMDQIPLSTNKDIDVEETEISDAEYNEETGELSWVKTIPAGGSVKIRVGYEIKYPKDKVLRGL